MTSSPTCSLTETARSVIEVVRANRTGPLTLVVSNGCCDGTAPYLYENYLPPTNAVKMLEVDGIIVYLAGFMASVADAAGATGYIIDAVPDAQNDSLSLESDFGWRLSVRLVPVKRTQQNEQ